MGINPSMFTEQFNYMVIYGINENTQAKSQMKYVEGGSWRFTARQRSSNNGHKMKSEL